MGEALEKATDQLFQRQLEEARARCRRNITRSTVFFDIESGGLDPAHPDIQLAAVAVDQESLEELASLEVKIQFNEADADPEALKLNHYDREVWAREAVPASVAVNRFSRFLDGFRAIEFVSKRTGMPYLVARLAGHNADRFDGPRLKALFERQGAFAPWDPRIRCTCQLAMWFFDANGIPGPENYKLETLCRYFAIRNADDTSHDALADVRLTIELARTLAAAWRLQGHMAPRYLTP